jgi:ABC-type bacteriocin/lantibiotic exporter with double-glycine peptidase domain
MNNNNIIIFLLKRFCTQHKLQIFSIFMISLLISVIQVNVLSLITAKIIQSLQSGLFTNSIYFFKIFIGISIVYIILMFAYKTIQNKMISNLGHWVKQDVMHIMLKINGYDYMQTNFSKLVSPLQKIASASYIIVNNLLSFLLPNIALLFVIVGFFVYKSQSFGLIFICLNIILILYISQTWNKLMKYNNEYEKLQNTYDNYIVEVINNFDKVVHTGQNKTEINNISNLYNKTTLNGYDYYAQTNKKGLISNIILHINIFICSGYLIYLFINKHISITVFITFFTILIIYKERFLWTINSIPDLLQYIGRSYYLLDVFNDLPSKYNALQNLKFEKHDLAFQTIEFQNVFYKYNSNKSMILHNYNHTYKFNHNIIGIFGPSGMGKSTLAKMFIKLHNPISGKIRIDGVDIKDIDNIYIRQNIKYINQSSRLFDRTVYANLFYACSLTNTTSSCESLLQEINKFPKIKELLDKINSTEMKDKPVGLFGENLSGGQRQIINIVSGLISESKIIILDEPTNALDSLLKKDFIKMLHYFKKFKQGILVITHDKELIPILDEVIQL